MRLSRVTNPVASSSNTLLSSGVFIVKARSAMRGGKPPIARSRPEVPRFADKYGYGSVATDYTSTDAEKLLKIIDKQKQKLQLTSGNSQTRPDKAFKTEASIQLSTISRERMGIIPDVT